MAMITQSGNVAVNALGSRRGHPLPHRGLDRQPGGAATPATGSRRSPSATGCGSVALFLESDGDGARLAEALARCAERGVGVAVLKVGSSEAGARAAAAHTGALAGDQRVFRALVEEAGAAWAEDPHELLELARALAEPRARPRGDGGLAVLTCSGGDSGIAADEAARSALELPALAPATERELAELLPDAATIGNPLDYTSMIWGDDRAPARDRRRGRRRPGDRPAAALLRPPQGRAGRGGAGQPSAQGLVAGADDGRGRDAGRLDPPRPARRRGARELADRGLPAIAGLRTALLCARALRRPPADPARLREIAAAARAHGPTRPAATATAGSTRPSAKDAAARRRGRRCPTAASRDDADGCVRGRRRIGWPVALKLSAPELRHKSEAGALALGLGDEAALARGLRPAARSARRRPRRRLLVERMAAPGVELLVAARADAVVPALVVGLGGIWTEALDDVAIVPLPADAERVERGAARRCAAPPLLTGGRGREPVDLAAVAELAARVGRAAARARASPCSSSTRWSSARDGCVALDALARRRRADPAASLTL